MIEPDWIALDWGTSRLRAWAMSPSGDVLAGLECDRGMKDLESSDFEPVLLERISPWLPSGRRGLVIACGMVGSREGWIEVPYMNAPCRPLGDPIAARVASGRFQMWICPGIKQEAPADVMRGEETQMAGLLAIDAGFDGTVCLPGTHSKWVSLRSGMVCNFQTFLTGELFNLLAEQSVLRHAMAQAGWDRDAFLGAVNESASAPGTLSSRLFSIRADSLLHQQAGATARARLSGYLIGAELAAAEPFWLGQEAIALVGTGSLTELYAAAFLARGREVKVYAGDRLTLAGLQAAYLKLNRS